jgi:lipopolysaccharide export system protein LptC
MTALYQSGAAAPSTSEPHRARLAYLSPATRKVSQGRIYSLFVRVAKVVLPVLGIALIALALMWPNLTDRLATFIGFVPAAINVATEDYQVFKLTMEGIDRHDRPYMFSAETAIKFDADLDEVDLARPNADLVRENGSWLALMAEHGLYLKAEKKLLLRDDVNVFNDDGYEFNTDSMLIDLETGEVSGDVPIMGHGEFGELTSTGGYRFTDDGDRIEFKGPVRLVIYPGMENGQ